MTLITRSSTAGADTGSLIKADQIAGDLYAGEALSACAPCYIKASDGLVYQSNATAADEPSKIDGWTQRAVAAGQPVTLYGAGSRFGYGTGLTPGANYYLGATAGRLDDGPTVGGATPIARAINATDIRVLSNADFGKLRFAGALVFVSTEQTGNGSQQSIAHGLGVTPAAVLIVPTDLTPSTVGQYAAVEGTHTSTNVLATVTNGKKYKVLAWA